MENTFSIGDVVRPDINAGNIRNTVVARYSEGVIDLIGDSAGHPMGLYRVRFPDGFSDFLWDNELILVEHKPTVQRSSDRLIEYIDKHTSSDVRFYAGVDEHGDLFFDAFPQDAGLITDCLALPESPFYTTEGYTVHSVYRTLVVEK